MSKVCRFKGKILKNYSQPREDMKEPMHYVHVK